MEPPLCFPAYGLATPPTGHTGQVSSLICIFIWRLEGKKGYTQGAMGKDSEA